MSATAPSTDCGARCWSTSTRTWSGLTATPSKQTIGFFNQNLVMEYNHERAVADGVNVGYEVYRIRTEVSEQGGKVEKGFYVDRRSNAPLRLYVFDLFGGILRG